MDRPDYKTMLDVVAKARRDAWNTVPRDSNDHLEAGMFLAMFDAAFTYMRSNPPPAAAASVAEPAAVGSPATPMPEGYSNYGNG